MVHNESTYRNHHCRCDVCRKDATKMIQKRRTGQPDGKCLFDGKRAKLYSRGVCRRHYNFCQKLVKTRIRTWEELALGGYLTNGK